MLDSPDRPLSFITAADPPNKIFAKAKGRFLENLPFLYRKSRYSPAASQLSLQLLNKNKIFLTYISKSNLFQIIKPYTMTCREFVLENIRRLSS